MTSVVYPALDSGFCTAALMAFAAENILSITCRGGRTHYNLALPSDVALVTTSVHFLWSGCSEGGGLVTRWQDEAVNS